MSAVPIQKPFVRTRSTYSRRMTAKIFLQLIGSSLDRAGLFHSRFFDGREIDLLELRLTLGEGLDLVPLEAAAQELAPVDTGLERHDELAVRRGRGAHTRQARDLGRGGAQREAKVASRALSLQLTEISLKDLLRLRHEDDLVAELLRLLEHVRRKENRLPARAEVHQVLFDERRVDRVEPREDLVQDEDLRIVDDRRDELDLLLHPFREFIHFLVEPGAKLQLVEPLGDPLLG